MYAMIIERSVVMRSIVTFRACNREVDIAMLKDPCRRVQSLRSLRWGVLGCRPMKLRPLIMLFGDDD